MEKAEREVPALQDGDESGAFPFVLRYQ